MPRWMIIVGRTAWIIPALIPFGMLTWLAFLYPGIRMRNRWFIVISIIYLGFAIAEAIAITNDADGEQYVVGWALGIIMFVIGLRWWLPWHLAPKPASAVITTGQPRP